MLVSTEESDCPIQAASHKQVGELRVEACSRRDIRMLIDMDVDVSLQVPQDDLLVKATSQKQVWLLH
jgi:hypothetical protein